MKLYIELGIDDYGEYSITRISLSPFDNCYYVELKEDEILELYGSEEVPENFIPWQGHLSKYDTTGKLIERIYKDGKCVETIF